MFKFLKKQPKKDKVQSDKTEEAPNGNGKEFQEDTRKKEKKPVKSQSDAKPKKSVSSKSGGNDSGEQIKRGKTNSEAGFGILVKPHATEKTAHAGSYDTYSFIVSKDANKIEIKNSFFKMYGVKPVQVRIVNMPAKRVFFRRIAGVRPSCKKAYIRVPKNTNISVYEGV